MNIAKINSLVASFVFLIGLAILSNVLSLIIWDVVSPVNTSNRFIVKSNNTSDNDGSKINLASYDLFGKKPVKEVKAKPKRKSIANNKVVKTVAPKVTLKVRGILFGVNNFAIIESEGEQDTYAVGEYLSYLYILDIGPDYVIFDNDGIEYKIFVSEENSSVGGQERTRNSSNVQKKQQVTQNPTKSKKQVITPNLKKKDKENLNKMKSQLSKNPLGVLGKVNVLPHRQGGRLLGYQVSPGSEKELFGKLGLKSGDIVVSVNGKSLSQVNNFSEGMKLVNELSSANNLDMLINRRGVEQQIYINLK